MLIRSITQNAMDKKVNIRQFPTPEHPYIAFPQKKPAVLNISRFTTGEIGPQSRLPCEYGSITIEYKLIRLTQRMQIGLQMNNDNITFFVDLDNA